MHRRAVQRYHRYRERGAQYGPDESLEIPAAEIVSAPDYVALGLGIKPSDAVMMRRRITSRVGVGPAEISTSWWPAALAEVAPRLLKRESLEASAAFDMWSLLLDGKLHVQATRCRRG
jgi:GntR family transcriptional regulator